MKINADKVPSAVIEISAKDNSYELKSKINKVSRDFYQPDKVISDGVVTRTSEGKTERVATFSSTGENNLSIIYMVSDKEEMVAILTAVKQFCVDAKAFVDNCEVVAKEKEGE